ncbi:MAG: single-stranded-DNA-specific exonuclease RecJ [Nitrospirae bacterium]|nr:single-stranded-DNA-specific exonuclease RecJ [Nitrospirota bacterium]
MHRQWFVNRTNPEYIKYLSRSSSVSPVLAQILINRSIKTPEQIISFLNPNLAQLSDPFTINGMETAVTRILKAADQNETVLVHGDYDADGITATAIVLKLLKALGINTHYIIPHRMINGYGFKPYSIQYANQVGASLIITVDCGITSVETVSLCREEGIDVIITDHHEPFRSQNKDDKITNDDFLLPDALTIINPKISNSQSPVFNLSGAGIAFKLAQAFANIKNSSFSIYDFLALAALGTIADVVPLTGENRVIVKEGLKLIENGTPGLHALKQVSGIDKRDLKASLLLFTLIPRINACGRISDANDAIKLFLTDSDEEAMNIALWLEKLNKERQQIEEAIYTEAMHLLNKKGINPVIVLSSEGWHRGVIGIVASKITEAFFRPAILFSIEGSYARGSARSIPSFDIHKALTRCNDYLTAFGGHKQAAGLEIKAEKIPDFEEHINKIAKEILTEKDLIPLLEIDADVNLSDISSQLMKELTMLEPFGTGNSEPLLGSKRLEIIYPRIVGNNHLKMKLKQKNQSLDAIGFDMGSYCEQLTGSNIVDAVFTPHINEWEGNRSLQLHLKAIRPSQ